jgi:replicative DNA helicase
MTPEDIRVAADCAIRDLAAARLYIRDDLQNVRDIVATARSYARRQGVKLIVVDYLTLCEPGEKHANWNLAVGAMAKAFKRLAKQTGAAVMVLAQLSRDSVKQNRVPQLSDLRDSGEIEQHADIVMFIDHASTPPAKPPATMELLLRVAKYRQDQTREFCLWFNRPLMQFTTGVQNDG